MSKLIVLGDVVTDVVAKPVGPLTVGTDTGAAVVLRPGGSGANMAAWAGFCGAPTVFLGRVGADTAKWHRDALVACGVDARLRVDAKQSTAMVIAVIDPSGERTMITDRGASAGMGVADWDDSLLDDASWLHVSGYLLFSDAGRELAFWALERARSRGVMTSLDPSSSGFIVEYGVDRFLSDVAIPQVWLPNADEACVLSGLGDPVAGAVELSRGGRTVVVTLGFKGHAVAVDGVLMSREGAVDVVVVDSVGAGDAFAGGFVASMLSGLGVAGAAVRGAVAAKAAVCRVGGRPVDVAGGGEFL